MTYVAAGGPVITSPFRVGAPAIPPSMPVSLFPTQVGVGEPVTITGPFTGMFGAQVRVKFDGADWQSPTLLGPGTATVTVPEGARTGPCEVEVNGQTRWAGQCFINERRTGMGNYFSALGLIANNNATLLQQVATVPITPQVAEILTQPGTIIGNMLEPAKPSSTAPDGSMLAPTDKPLTAYEQGVINMRACTANGDVWIGGPGDGTCQTEAKLSAALAAAKSADEIKLVEMAFAGYCERKGGSYVNGACSAPPGAAQPGSPLPIATLPPGSAAVPIATRYGAPGKSLMPVIAIGGAVLVGYLLLRKR